MDLMGGRGRQPGHRMKLDNTGSGSLVAPLQCV